jgi:UDP-glucuronate 4-epimerase
LLHEKTERCALVTGSSGFIGFHLCQLLLKHGWRVIGLDSLNDYYDVQLKRRRESILNQSKLFKVIHEKIESKSVVSNILRDNTIDAVIHLAAQAGVRYSIDHPRDYMESNIIGTFEILEAVREYPVKHSLIASTSSAYGSNTEMPYHELQKCDHQLSFYAATKKSSEIMAHSYSHIYNTPITMFRFFTVYGPWGRPDMALFKFTKAMLNGDKIDIYNNGNMQRDFTYVEDLVEAIRLLIDCEPSSSIDKPEDIPIDSMSPIAKHRLVNIGNSQSIQLMDFIKALENTLGITAKKNYLPMQMGDVPATWADTTLLKRLTGYSPKTNVEEGVRKFVEWYRFYYNI